MSETIIEPVVGWCASCAIYIRRRISDKESSKDELHLAVLGDDVVLGREAIVAGVATRPGGESKPTRVPFAYRVALREVLEPGKKETLVSIGKLEKALEEAGWQLKTVSTGDLFVSVHVPSHQDDNAVELRLRFEYSPEGPYERPPESLTLTTAGLAKESEEWELARNEFRRLRRPGDSSADGH